MKNKTLKIGLSCFIGALIGAFIGLQFKSVLGLTVSIITGSVSGYLLWEFDKVLKAIPKAISLTNQVKRKKWSRETFQLKMRIFILNMTTPILVTTTLASLVGFVAFLNWLGVDDTLPVGPKLFWIPLSYGITTIALISFFGFFVGLIILFLDKKYIQHELFNAEILFAKNKRNLILLNPISLPFVAVFFTLKFLFWVAKDVVPKIPYALMQTFRWFWRFFKHLFILIHSEIRLICLVDAGIGAGIGFVFSSPVIGGLAGAVFGILNYWIVSIKILKLKPAK